MMYKPAFFEETRKEKIEELILEHAFAPLISVCGGQLQISHLPFLQVEENRLVSHMARANPHWKEFAQNPSVTILFQGPHAYISPAWYVESPLNVPTWNYTTVHVRGRATLIDDPVRAATEMQRLVDHFENHYGTHWKLNPAALDSKLAGIVVFEIAIEAADVKFKLSQQQSPENRALVQEALADRAPAVARLMLSK